MRTQEVSREKAETLIQRLLERSVHYCPSFFIKVVRCQLVEQGLVKIQDAKPKHYQFHVYYEAEALTSTLTDLKLIVINHLENSILKTGYLLCNGFHSRSLTCSSTLSPESQLVLFAWGIAERWERTE